MALYLTIFVLWNQYAHIWWIYVLNYNVFLVNHSLNQYKVSLSLLADFGVISVLSDIWTVTLALHLLGVPFPSFNPKIVSNLMVRWISWRQQIDRSCFSIHSFSLCLLIGELRPLLFIVIEMRVSGPVIWWSYSVWFSSILNLLNYFSVMILFLIVS